MEGYDFEITRSSKYPSVIESRHFLKENPEKAIKTLFSKTFTLENTSSEGVENFRVQVSVDNPAMNLLEPEIIGRPKSINVKKIGNNSSNQHDWNIDLLNPNEAIVFAYAIYSEEEVDNFTISFSPRKKDWKVETDNPFEDLRKSRLEDTKRELQSFVTITSFMLVALLGFLRALYRYRWNKVLSYRNEYKSFQVFWSKHSPFKLFDR